MTAEAEEDDRCVDCGRELWKFEGLRCNPCAREAGTYQPPTENGEQTENQE